MAEGDAPERIEPRGLDDYLDVMSKAVFQSGMSWRVVEAKWPGIRKAFHGFDVETVARMTEEDLDRLAENPDVIRNRRKLGAVVHNAGRIRALDEENGTFRAFLHAHDGFEATLDALKKEFRFLGDMGAYYFLYVVGEEVPAHEEAQGVIERRRR